jgi:hypothetical protein
MLVESRRRVAEAHALGEQTLAVQRRLLGDEHPETLSTMGNVAGAYAATGDTARAIPLAEHVAVVHRRVLDDEHLYTRAAVWVLDRIRAGSG